jgi:hypothetical protein
MQGRRTQPFHYNGASCQKQNRRKQKIIYVYVKHNDSCEHRKAFLMYITVKGTKNGTYTLKQSISTHSLRATFCKRHSVVLPAGEFAIKKRVSFIPLTKLRQKGESSLKLIDCLFMQTFITLLIHFATKVPK